MFNLSINKMSVIKSILIAAFPVTMMISPIISHAEEASAVVSNQEAVRRAIINQGGASVLIGLSTQKSKEEDIQFMVKSLLPTQNYISQQTNTIVSFVPERNKRVYENDLKIQAFQFIFCEFESCVSALSNGYKPILKRDDLQRAVLIAKSSSGIKREDQVTQGMKLGVYGDSTVKTLAAGSLSSVNLMTPVDLNQHTIASSIESARAGEVDLVLTSSNNLSRMIGHLPGQFNIVAKSKSVPNAMLLVREGTSQDLIDKFTTSFTSSPDISEILLATDQRYSSSLFQIMTAEDVVVLAEIVESSKKSKEALDKKAGKSAAARE